MFRARNLPLAGLSLLVIAGCGGPPHVASGSPAPITQDWRASLSPGDRDRLRDWRQAFVAALAGARAGGAGARIGAEGVLLQPDAGMEAPSPPDGAYRCRMVKLGARTPPGPAFTTYPRFNCRIAGSTLMKLDGSQRPSGALHTDPGGRLVFVGTMALGDETGAMAYGRDAERDMVGYLERIGPRRWRLILPYPRWESILDVLELVPAA